MYQATSRTVLCLLLFTASVVAQTETGQITGTVTDPSGAAIPTATIAVKARATGAIRNTTTSAAGTYAVTNLQPAAYTVTVSSSGFTTLTREVTVAVGAAVGEDFQLQVGQAATEVTVSETAVQVNTENQTLQTVVDTQRIMELPSLTRNPYDFVATAGDVAEGDPGGNSRFYGVGFAINGQRGTSTNVMLDGASNNDEFGGVVGQQVPLDSVQEYSIMTADFTAEYGRAAGGVVNVVSKSGTNDWHGSAYEYNRVSDLAANTYSNNSTGQPESVFVRNQFGYSVGGPVIKNKLFFFNNIEWTRVRSPATLTAFVPTPQFIAAAAPATQAFFQAYGNLGTARPLQVYTKDQISALNGGNICGGPLCNALAGNTPMFELVSYTAQYDVGAGSPQNTVNAVGRIDYNMSDRTQMYFMYSLFDQNTFAGSQSNSPYPGYNTGTSAYDNDAVFSFTHTFSPTLVSQSKLAFQRINNDQPLGSAGVTPGLYLYGGSTLLGQSLAFPGYYPYSPGAVLPSGGPQNIAQAYEDMSYTRGKHTFRYGGMFTYVQVNQTFGASETAIEANSTGSIQDGIEQFLAGQLDTFTVAVYPQGKFPCSNPAQPTPSCTIQAPIGAPGFSRSDRDREFAVYGEDSWKVSPRVTLNLGLRWEYFGVQHNNNPQLDSNFYDAPGEADTPAGIRGGSIQIAPNSPIGALWKSDYGDVGPRLGVAWDVFGDQKTSFRAGYGRYFERNFGNVTYNVIQNPPGQYVLNLTAGVDVPQIPVSASNYGPLSGATGSFPVLAASLRSVDPNIKTAHSDVWSSALERQFGASILGAIEYSGSHGADLYSISNVNRAGYGNVFLNDPCDPANNVPCTARLTPLASTMNRRGNLGYSNYDGVNFRFRVNNIANSGLNLLANYTWSHSLDNGSNTFSDYGFTNNGELFTLGQLDPWNPKIDYGNSDFDIRHRVAISFTYDLPAIGERTSMLNRVFGGWTLAPIFTARSGYHYSVYDCTGHLNVCRFAAFSSPIQTSVGQVTPNPVPNSFTVLTIPGSAIDHAGNAQYGFTDLPPFPSDMLGRNAFVGPNFWNLDMGLYKRFHITERMALQLRGEAYNIFNHPNLWADGSSAEVSGAGGTTNATINGFLLGNRNIQIAARVDF